MIRMRFNEIISSRNLKRTVISEDTGISRTTLSSISTNSTEMVRLETIDKLCRYLNISPTEFFDYFPGSIGDIKIEIKSIEELGDVQIIITINLDTNEDKFLIKLEGLFELVEKELADSIRDNTKENNITYVMGEFKFIKNKGYNFIKDLSFNAQELVIYSIAKEIHKVLKSEYHIEIVGVFLNI